MNLRSDIVIIGSGIAGFTAAFAASRKGMKVVMIEKSNRLGGNAVQSNVGTICGAYYHTSDEIFKPLEHPFLQKLIADLNLQPLSYHQGFIVLPYQVEKLAEYMKKTLDDHGIEILFECELKQVIQVEQTISGLRLVQGDQEIEISAAQFIDASGGTTVAKLARLKTISEEVYQSASQVFSVTGIISDDEYSLNMAIKAALIRLIKTRDLPESLKSASINPGSLNSGCASIKFAIPEKITQEVTQTYLDNQGKFWSIKCFEVLKENLPSFKSAQLEHVFPQAGVRVRSRNLGKHILTEAEVLGCSKFKDVAAVGTWPIEVWLEDGRVEMTYLIKDDFYQIPLACIQSAEISNLTFAGKNISATPRAIASARVMGTCIQTGWAAGLLAAERVGT